MYLRTGKLFKTFAIEKKSEGTTARGRATSSYDKTLYATLSAVLADAKPEEKERWNQQQHPITHIITQTGTPLAGVGDRLVQGDRIFYIQGVENPGSLNIWTIYYAQERSDAHDGY